MFVKRKTSEFSKSYYLANYSKNAQLLIPKEIKPVNPKGNQPYGFIGRTDAKAPILWPRDAKSRLTGKDLDAAKD